MLYYVFASNNSDMAYWNYTDQYGQSWTRVERDAFAQEDYVRCDCGAVVSTGWLCLDGGQEVCDDGVVLCQEFIVRRLQANEREKVSSQNRVRRMFNEIKSVLV